MTTSLPIQGLSYLVVTVQSVDGNLAFVRADQAGGRTFNVRRDFLRAKAPLPQPGEQWIIERVYGVDGWVFSLLLNGDVQTPMLAVPDATTRTALVGKYPDMIVYQMDSYSAWRWTGTAWQERIPPSIIALQAQVATLQSQVAALQSQTPRGLVKIVRWPSDITIINTGAVLMESLAVAVVAGRTYRVTWHVNQAGSLAAGPPNGQGSIVTASNTVVAASPTLRTTGIRVYNATQEVLTLSGYFDATVNETRAFGVTGNSGSSSASITFYGGQGRHLSVEDVGLTPS